MFTRLIVLPLFCVFLFIMLSGATRAEHHNATAFNSTFELQNIVKRADAHVK